MLFSRCIIDGATTPRSIHILDYCEAPGLLRSDHLHDRPRGGALGSDQAASGPPAVDAGRRERPAAWAVGPPETLFRRPEGLLLWTLAGGREVTDSAGPTVATSRIQTFHRAVHKCSLTSVVLENYSPLKLQSRRNILWISMRLCAPYNSGSYQSRLGAAISW